MQQIFRPRPCSSGHTVLLKVSVIHMYVNAADFYGDKDSGKTAIIEKADKTTN